MPEGVGYGPQYTASTGLTLNYIGKFVYALSSSVLSNTAYAAQTTMLEFTTGANVIDAKFIFSGFCGVDGGSASAGTRGIMTIKFNSEVVMQVMSDTDAGNMMTTIIPQMIIPPYTNVEVLCTSALDSVDYYAQAAISGNIHGRIK